MRIKMNVETLKWGAKKLREIAPQWAKDARPVFAALGIGIGGVLREGKYDEGPLPTEEELLKWLIQSIDFFGGQEMQQCVLSHPTRDRFSLACHHVHLEVYEFEGQRAYGISIVVNSVQGSG